MQVILNSDFRFVDEFLLKSICLIFVRVDKAKILLVMRVILVQFFNIGR